VGVYVAKGHLFVVESGGPQDAFERARPSLDWMKQQTFVVR
jgi:hypothetical protein